MSARGRTPEEAGAGGQAAVSPRGGAGRPSRQPSRPRQPDSASGSSYVHLRGLRAPSHPRAVVFSSPCSPHACCSQASATTSRHAPVLPRLAPGVCIPRPGQRLRGPQKRRGEPCRGAGELVGIVCRESPLPLSVPFWFILETV